MHASWSEDPLYFFPSVFLSAILQLTGLFHSQILDAMIVLLLDKIQHFSTLFPSCDCIMELSHLSAASLNSANRTGDPSKTAYCLTLRTGRHNKNINTQTKGFKYDKFTHIPNLLTAWGYLSVPREIHPWSLSLPWEEVYVLRVLRTAVFLSMTSGHGGNTNWR